MSHLLFLYVTGYKMMKNWKKKSLPLKRL